MQVYKVNQRTCGERCARARESRLQREGREAQRRGGLGLLTVASKQRDEAERIAKVMALAYTSCPQCQAAYRRGRFYRPYFICPCCGRRWSQNRVIDALGGWLSKLHEQYPWDWFATLTFANERFTPGSTVSRGDITPDGAAYWFRHWLHDAGDVGGAQPYAFRADEYGPLHGRYHLHALIGNVAHLQHYCGEKLPKGEWGKSCCWVHRWPCGIARIFHYDPRRGAHFYLSKYVIKALANWDVIGFESEDLVFKAHCTERAVPIAI